MLVQHFDRDAFLPEVDTNFPTRFRWWNGGRLTIPADGTHFIYCEQGRCRVSSSAGEITLRASMFAGIPGALVIDGEGGGVIATRVGFDGIALSGGPIESEGRLSYIDGCSATLLIAPWKRGDPCLNFLYVPPGIDQTPHTHPSVRIGVIVEGEGHCRTPEEEYSLDPGTVIVMPPNQLHGFHTADRFLRIVVYHPDSDTGPSDEEHPMLSRTIVDGVSARELQEIWTTRMSADSLVKK
jgi:mannose-6-phosphate isomerase-like protein (cupin superfamily)